MFIIDFQRATLHVVVSIFVCEELRVQRFISLRYMRFRGPVLEQRKIVERDFSGAKNRGRPSPALSFCLLSPHFNMEKLL